MLHPHQIDLVNLLERIFIHDHKRNYCLKGMTIYLILVHTPVSKCVLGCVNFKPRNVNYIF